MPWARVAADLIVVIHASFVAFVVLGMLAILVGLASGWRWVRNFWFRTLHLAAITVVAAEAVVGVSCPLTVLENELRQHAGQVTYPGAFIGYWAHRLIFFQGEPWMFTLGYTLFGLAVVGAYLAGPPRWPWKTPAGTTPRSDSSDPLASPLPQAQDHPVSEPESTEPLRASIHG